MSDLPELLRVYGEARDFMAQSGNPKQWGPSGYPQKELLEEDIRKGRLFVLTRGERIAAAFVLAAGAEPTYRVIEAGEWRSDKPYLTIHRLGSRKDEHGCARAVLDFCKNEAHKKGLDLRADTHEDNKPMLRILEKYGFAYCGMIHVADGSPRRAFRLELE